MLKGTSYLTADTPQLRDVCLHARYVLRRVGVVLAKPHWQTNYNQIQMPRVQLRAQTEGEDFKAVASCILSEPQLRFSSLQAKE